MSQEPKIYTQSWMEKEADLFLKWMSKPDSIFYKQFAVERGYQAQRLHEFADKCPKFALAMSMADDWQEAKLVTQAFWGHGNPNIAKFVLAVKHKWVDPKPEIHIHSGVFPDVDGKSKDLINDQS